MDSNTWSAEETKLLISLFGAQDTQNKLGGLYRNKNVYREISQKMVEHGFEKTADQCRVKIKNLKAKYKKTKDSNRRSGTNRVTCPFFEELDAILCDHPSSQPCALLDSAAREEEADESEVDSGDDRSGVANIEDLSDAEGPDNSQRSAIHVDPDASQPSTPTPTRTPTAVENTYLETGESTSSAETDRTPSAKRTRAPTRSGKRKKSKLDTSLDRLATVFVEASEKDRKAQFELLAQQQAHEMAMLREILGVFRQQQQQGTPPPTPPPRSQDQHWQPQWAWANPPTPSHGQLQWHSQEQPQQSSQAALNGAAPTLRGHTNTVVQRGDLSFQDM